jgi:PIN domain nuclease of toxin-antitoxin system
MSLLDTHTVIWVAEKPHLLSTKANVAIRKARQHSGLAVSDKTLWELAMLISRRRVSVRTSLRQFLDAVERNFTVLPVTSAIDERSVLFSDRYPKDPADCIIGATAIVHGLELITADLPIRESGEVKTIW